MLAMQEEEMSYQDNEFDCLKGKTILSVEHSDETLRFNLKGDAVCFEAVGDCCSSSFIESLDNPEAFKDAVFDSVKSVSGESKDIDYEVHKWTFYKFKTSKGLCTLSFRNESNGYYDGYLRKIES
jgi:hypothetical protein